MWAAVQPSHLPFSQLLRCYNNLLKRQVASVFWAISKAENREHARQIVPWKMRDKARIVKLVKFELADPLHTGRS